MCFNSFLKREIQTLVSNPKWIRSELKKIRRQKKGGFTFGKKTFLFLIKSLRYHEIGLYCNDVFTIYSCGTKNAN